MNNKILLPIAIFLAFIFLSSSVFAADYVILGGIDKTSYLPGENMTVSGTVYYQTSVSAGTTVGLTVGGTPSSTQTDANGTFSSSITTSAIEGSYSLTISAGGATIVIPFVVSEIYDMIVEFVDETHAIELGDCAVGNAPENSTCGNFTTLAGTQYFVAVQNSSEYSEYSVFYLDNDANITDAPIYKYLEKDSILNLGAKEFTIIYIDPAGSEVVLAERVSSVFANSINTELFALALSSSRSPLNGKNLILKIFDDEGSLISTTAIGTTSSGIVEYNYTATGVGTYHMIINNIGHISYLIQKYKLRVSLETEEGQAVYLLSPGQNIVFTASIIDLTTDQVIPASADLHVEIFGPGVSETEDFTLINGTYTTTLQAPSESGKYNIKFTSTYNTWEEKAELEFEVRSYDLFMMPFAPQRGPGEGFSPGSPMLIIVNGKDMATGGFISLANLTNCSNSSVYLEGIYDEYGNNTLIGCPGGICSLGFNLTELWDWIKNDPTGPQQQVPDFIRDEMKDNFGEGACAIVSQAPAQTGIYDVRANVVLGNDTYELRSMIGIQDIFVYAYPASASGQWQYAVSPGGDVYLGINAYDAATGTPIAANKITNAELVEVWAEDSGVVTADMLNESFEYLAGNSIAAIHFVANDSILGNHFVKLKVTANVTRGGVEQIVNVIGQGWFTEKLYNIWAYPSQWMFGSTNNVGMTVNVYDSSGINAQQGISVYLANVRNFEMQENVNASAQMCTTNENGTCTLTIQPSSGTWGSGGHEVRIKITDGNNNTDYGYSWFEVRNFRFWAWTQNWEVATDQNVTMSVQVSDFSGSPMTANVTVEKLIYFGSQDNWRSPTTVAENFSISSNITGTGTITLPSGYAQQEGQYAVVLKAVSGSQTETVQAWFYARPFIIYVDVPNNWEHRYGTSDTVNITVTGYKNIDWSTWPPNGTAHNLSAAWVSHLRRDGMWDVDYKNKDELTTSNAMTSSCNGNVCNLTFNLTGFEQGNYNIDIIANDTSNAKARGSFWFRVEQLRITVPELMEWRRVSTENTLISNTYFQLSDSCGTDNDDPTEPTNVTNCVYGAKRILDALQSQPWVDYNTTYFLLDKTTGRLYINTTGNNFSTTDVITNFNKTIGDTFTDTAGYRWNITAIDVSSGYVYVDSLDGVVGKTCQGCSNTMLFNIDKSLSKSGKFLQGDMLNDDEWSLIDLDGDGIYSCNYEHCDQYNMIMADTVTSEKYDKLYISNTTNITAGFNAATGLTGQGDIRFNTSANPIYLLDIRYKAGTNGGYDSYNPIFTTNKPGWPGRELGIFRPGSIVKVPIMVTQPSDTSAPIANANVTIAKITSYGKMQTVSYTPQGNISKNTSSTGLVILDLNTSNLPTGDYFVEIQVKDSTTGEWITTGNMWDNPRVTIRNFVVRGDLGLRGQITGIREWSEAAGNLEIKYSDQVMQGGAFGMSDWGNGLFHNNGPWEWRAIYYNDTDETILVDQTPDDWNPTDNSISYNPQTQLVPLTKDRGSTEFLNVSVAMSGAHSTVVPIGASVIDSGYNFTVHSVGEDGAYVSIMYMPWYWWMAYQVTADVNEIVPYTWYSPFNVTSITAGNVTFTWDFSSMTLTSIWQPALQGDWKVMRLANISDDYELLLFNSPAKTTSADLYGWAGQVDTIWLINKTDGSRIGDNYFVGHIIPEIEKAVVKSEIWDERVYLSNATVKGSIIYPLPWYCDVAKFYIGNFTEQSAKMKVAQTGQEGVLTNISYYIMLWDDMCDGGFAVTSAKMDDDLDFADGWNSQTQQAWDYDGPESNPSGTLQSGEQWLSVGGMSWPFTITSFNDTTGVADLFSFRDWTEKGTNITLWISARQFDGAPINGNITIESVKGISYGSREGPVESDITELVNTTGPQNITNGIGYMTFDMTNVIGGDYSVKIKVTDNTGLQTSEILDSHFWVQAPMPAGGGGGTMPY